MHAEQSCTLLAHLNRRFLYDCFLPPPYVVFGDRRTGGTAAATIVVLLRSGPTARVLVRDPAKGQPWAERGAEVVVADLADLTSTVEALRRSSTCLSCRHDSSPKDRRRNGSHDR